MKTLIVTITFAAILVTSATAKTEKARPLQVESNSTVACGHIFLTDPDLAIRSSFRRECGHYMQPGN
jgi:hypothetical protein